MRSDAGRHHSRSQGSLLRPAGDTVTFQNGEAFAFGAIPTNGLDPLDEASGVGTNTPKNYAGVEGSVDASPVAAPSSSVAMIGLMIASLRLVGAIRMHRSRLSS